MNISKIISNNKINLNKKMIILIKMSMICLVIKNLL